MSNFYFNFFESALCRNQGKGYYKNSKRGRLWKTTTTFHIQAFFKLMSDLRRGNSGDLDREQGSSLLTEKPKENNDIPFCGCLSVRYYQPYFDVDTADVTSRLTSSLLYCRSEQNFLTTVKERPDAYGPFWVRLILIIYSLSFLRSYIFSCI